jgi:hypothetical protein
VEETNDSTPDPAADAGEGTWTETDDRFERVVPAQAADPSTHHHYDNPSVVRDRAEGHHGVDAGHVPAGEHTGPAEPTPDNRVGAADTDQEASDD